MITHREIEAALEGLRHTPASDARTLIEGRLILADMLAEAGFSEDEALLRDVVVMFVPWWAEEAEFTGRFVLPDVRLHRGMCADAIENRMRRVQLVWALRHSPDPRRRQEAEVQMGLATLPLLATPGDGATRNRLERLIRQAHGMPPLTDQDVNYLQDHELCVCWYYGDAVGGDFLLGMTAEVLRVRVDELRERAGMSPEPVGSMTV